MVKWNEFSIISTSKKTWPKITPETKLAFLSAFVIGFITHCYGFFNLFLNHDGIDNMFDYKDMTTSGRWLLKAACALSGEPCLPLVIGLLSLFYLSLACALLTALFKIRHKGYIVLLSAFVAAFPAVTQTFLYMFTADGYMLSFLLAVAAVYVARRYRLGLLFAAPLIGLSLGIYQASVSVCIVLFTLIIAVDILDGVKTKAVFSAVLKYLVSGAVGCGLYFAVLKVVLAIRHLSLTSYQGIGEMTAAPDTGLNSVIASIAKELLALMFKYGSNGFAGTTVLYILLLVFAALISIVVILRAVSAKIYRRPVLFLLLPVLFLSLPVSMCCILFISPSTNYYGVMFMSFSIVFAAVPIILDRYMSVSSFSSFIHKYLTLAISVFYVFHFIIYANYTYVEAGIQMKNTDTLMTQVLSDLYKIDNFEKKPMAFFCDPDMLEGDLPYYMYGNFKYVYLGHPDYIVETDELIFQDLIVYLKLYHGIDCIPMKWLECRKAVKEPGYETLFNQRDQKREYNIIEYDGKIFIWLNHPQY